ncbi:oxygen-independent coproporphyrinogen III oxidase [Sphingomonas sp. LHG3406-1]|uniref:oxygen-independent coproporphyrinogen III oxidase n=1 Tax=Sphingomonas sp. LHG3406-1 TaxID=2804617 RepID=UPI00261E984A|nr:oxygen-independent coproporphyrinogen III oxidase [Sphingomonas sp. LHG3406-1]
MTARLNPELIARYGERNVPRYTSYPTAPHFAAADDDACYRDWLAALPAGEAVSLYVHVPFCRAMCWYCGCHTSVTRREAPVSRYVAALSREIDLVSGLVGRGRKAAHLHFGGGTPTLIRPEEFTGLMDRLRERFLFGSDTEAAIEIDPRTLEPEMAEALGRGGITRASIGVQSFDPQVQAAINRLQSFAVTREAVERLRGAGIAAINFDLLYGLPFQTVANCLETVEQALVLRPDRLSLFGYAHVPSFKAHQRKIAADVLPASAERLAQFEAMAARLAAAGYEQIGLDHFALPEDSMARAAAEGRLHRNFQGYTTDACPTLLGFGASSIGRLPQGFVQNAATIPDYERRIASGRLATVRQCALSLEDRRRAALIERLMCDYRVDLSGADDLADEARLAPLAADGLIRRAGPVIEIVAEARPLVRSVAAAFDAYLDAGTARHARAV